MKKPDRQRKSSRPHNARRQSRPQRATAPQRHADTGQGYGARVMAAVASGGLVRAGGVTQVTVHHDERCRAYHGPCICQPDIECVDASGNVHVVGPTGEVVNTSRRN